MLTSSRSSIISSVGRSQQIYHPAAEREITPQPIQSEGKFDSVILSASSGENRFYKDLVSKLTQEVRTATTTGDIRALKAQVSSGQYQPDASAIAARMLFFGEDV